MVIGEASINNIMGGIENTGTVRLHNHKRKLKQRFVIIKKLGQGTYGKVQLGVNKETGQEVAIKTIKKSKIETEADLIRIRREIQIMSSVQHPNIIHIYEVFENREKMVLVMEYAAGGELYDYLSERKVLVESEARRIFRQIATACFYCHKHKICHRDLKLENILLDENGNAKIADFGLSNVFDESRLLSTFCGSPLYASPEIVKGTPYIGPEVDCWSLGVLLYTLVYGAMPFDGSNFKRLVRQISAADYSEPARPSPASPLIREMLAVDPTQRATIEGVCAHWWVNEGQEEQCLVQAEALAAQTPVRLDLLLALAPPVVEGMRDKLVVTDIADESAKPPADTMQPIPTRSQSVGSIMELTGAGPVILPPAERRIKELLHPEQPDNVPTTTAGTTAQSSNTGATPKRKLEPSISTSSTGGTSNAQVQQSKQKLAKERTVADVTTSGGSTGLEMDIGEEKEINRSATKVVLGEINLEDKEGKMEVVEDKERDIGQGAACIEILKEQELKQPDKAEKIPELPDKENANTTTKAAVKTTTKKPVKKKVLGDKNTDEAPNNGNKIIKKIVKPKSSTTASNEKGAPVKTESVSNSSAISSDSIETASVASSLANGDLTAKKVNEKPSADEKEKDKDEKTVKPSPSSTRRRSTIFEQAEKFQSMLAPSESKTTNVVTDKPKKIIIPGVSVGGFKKEFERKASLTSTSPPKLKTTPSKKLVINDRSTSTDKDDDVMKSEEKNNESKVTSPPSNKSVPSKTKSAAQTAIGSTMTNQMTSPTTSLKTSTSASPTTTSSQSTPISTATQTPSKTTSSTSPTAPASVSLSALVDASATALATEGTGDRASQVKNAVSIISSALEEGARKSRSRPCMMQPGAGRKPPVPFGIGGRSATCSMAGGVPSVALVGKRELLKMHSIPAPSAPQSLQNAHPSDISNDDVQKTSNAEITLKSATLPRRKMTKAEIQLDYPQQQQQSSPPQMEFRTEMAHRVENPPQASTQTQNRKVQTQRSEATFPIYGPATKIGLRSASLEPESHAAQSPKERIIPISFEREDQRHGTISPPVKPPTPRASFASQKSNLSQRTNSSQLSRQSTLDSESGNDTVSESMSGVGEAIRKSAREYIIPIAVEGGGYVTPRAASLEPQQENVQSGSNSTIGANSGRTSTFSRRWKSAFSDRDGSEDEDRVGFSPFQRYTSFGKDSDSEDRDPFHMHRLRSSRPYKATLEHTDSVSSGEDDDDDGFEILTAENLFSTLLSRVRDLTQRLKVDDGVGRPGFPTSRLLSQFDHGTNFFSNVHPPLTRNSPLGRSFNREHSVSSSTGSTASTAQPHWRRSVSRDLAHDIQSVFGDRQGSVEGSASGTGGFHPTVTATLPRGAEDILCQNH